MSRLRFLREMLGLTQAGFESRFGLSRMWVSHRETEFRNVDQMAAIAIEAMIFIQRKGDFKEFEKELNKRLKMHYNKDAK